MSSNSGQKLEVIVAGDEGSVRLDRALAVRLALPPAKYSDGDAAKQFYDQLASRLQSVPGVDSLGAVSALPMSGLTALAQRGKPYVYAATARLDSLLQQLPESTG